MSDGAQPEPKPRRRKLGPWVGVKVHLTLWLGLVWLGVLSHAGTIFPGRGYLVALLLLALGALIPMLWVNPRTEAKARSALGIASLILLLLGCYELLSTFRAPKVGISRYPYPYRMHGFAPNERPETNRFGATSNGSGMRAAGPVPPRQPGERRILILGGSAIFGLGAKDEETPPRHLERMLQARLQERPQEGVESIRVINGGMGWYNSTQELIWLITELALYEPDLLVVVSGYNDAHHAIVWGAPPPANAVTSAFVEGLYDMPGTLIKRPTAGQALQGLAGASRTLRKLDPKSLFASPDLGVPVPERLTVGPGTRANEPLMRHRLIMNWTFMHRLGEAFGVKTMFALQPAIYVKQTLSPEERAWLSDKTYVETMSGVWKDLEAHVAERGEALGLRVFSADRTIRAHPGRLFTDYCHLIPEGNEMMARDIAEAVGAACEEGPWTPRWEGVRYEGPGDASWRPAELGAKPD